MKDRNKKWRTRGLHILRERYADIWTKRQTNLDKEAKIETEATGKHRESQEKGRMQKETRHMTHVFHDSTKEEAEKGDDDLMEEGKKGWIEKQKASE